MALTDSNMLALGTVAPDFDLTDVVTGNRVTRQQFKGTKALLVMFICRHCPYVIHVQDELARLGRDYIPKNVAIVAIGSNDVANYPDDAPGKLKEQAQNAGFKFPYLYDETQAVAHAYKAACTPDFYLFDADHKLVYRGQLDETRPGSNKPCTGRDLRAALDAVLAGQPVSTNQRPSSGCNIKWKHGNAPR
jgi:peroxiredoxin